MISRWKTLAQRLALMAGTAVTLLSCSRARALSMNG
jgi:hypothetical protein